MESSENRLRLAGSVAPAPDESESGMIRSALREPSEYGAMPVLVNLNLEAPVEGVRLPNSSEMHFMLHLYLILPSRLLRYSATLGQNGQPLLSPVRGMIPQLSARLLLPLENFTDAGAEELRRQKATLHFLRASAALVQRGQEWYWSSGDAMWVAGIESGRVWSPLGEPGEVREGETVQQACLRLQGEEQEALLPATRSASVAIV